MLWALWETWTLYNLGGLDLGNLLTVIIGKLDVLKNLTHAFQAESISGLFDKNLTKKTKS